MVQFLSPGINVSEYDQTTSVPNVSTGVGAIAGIFNQGPVNTPVLVGSEQQLVATFGNPGENNFETWFTAANFLNYSNSLYVVRVLPNAGNNAVANSGTYSTHPSVNNSVDYDLLYAANSSAPFGDVDINWVAKHPGLYGNSLRISVCDNPWAYASQLHANGLSVSSPLEVYANLSINISSNTASLIVTPGGGNSVADAATYANRLTANLSIGDIVVFGNSTIGAQKLKVTTIGSVTTNSSAAVASIAFDNVYRLAQAFTTSGSLNNLITRKWEFSDALGTQPVQTQYVKTYGNTAAYDEVHVVIVDNDGKVKNGVPGTPLEVFKGLSRATDAKTTSGADNYYARVINKNSKYVWWGAARTGSPVANAALIAVSSNRNNQNMTFSAGTDPENESNISLGTIAKGYDLYKSPDSIDISLMLQGKPTGQNTYELANYLIDICESRMDAIAFITPPDSVITNNPGLEAQSIVDWATPDSTTGGGVVSSSYAVVDSGYKYMYDKYNDKYRYVPLNGDIAGLCVRTDSTRDPWWSPAGYNRGKIKNVVKLRWNPTQTDRDLLYPNSVNPVVTLPGFGPMLYGDKTHQLFPSAFDHINVRRLFIVLEKAISRSAKQMLFEFNDEFTRAQFKAMINPYLRDIQGRRGITDFLVVCDATNNTPEVVDQGKFIGDIYVKPARSINFIQLNFVAVRTGVQFSEVVGKFGG